MEIDTKFWILVLVIVTEICLLLGFLSGQSLEIYDHYKYSSVQSVMYDSLRSQGQQHARPPCPSPTPGVYSNSCPTSHWHHPTISPSVDPFLPSVFLSIKVCCSESALRIRWPKYWSFNLIISPSNEYSGLISFKIDWLDLLAVQGTLKSLLQHYRSKASIRQYSAFFIVQFWYPYMSTGKTIALTRQTFVGKVMFLISNMLSRLVITFLPVSKHLLISWLQSSSAWFWRNMYTILTHIYNCFHIYSSIALALILYHVVNSLILLQGWAVNEIACWQLDLSRLWLLAILIGVWL